MFDFSYLYNESERKSEEVNNKLNILIEFKIHDPILTHRTYKILNTRMEGIQSRALGIVTNCITIYFGANSCAIYVPKPAIKP